MNWDYIGGFFDGEGSLIYYKSNSNKWGRAIKFVIAQKDPSVLRKIQRFLSQPFNVAETFTGSKGKYVKLVDTIKGFKEILEGKYDEKNEGDFYMKGGIEEVGKS